MTKLIDYIRHFRRKGIYPSLVDPGNFHRIMIVAPHPDDDVIGLGGLMTLRAKEVVQVVYVTNGAQGDPEGKPEETIAIRREEAIEAISILGVDRGALRFLDFPDGSLKDSPFARETISMSVRENMPNFLFVPFFIDNHPDHTSTVKIVSGVLEDLPLKLDVWCYETWSALVPSHLIDITPVIDSKLMSIKAHRSQVTNIDYKEKIRGLNSFRSMTAGNDVEYAEAFFRCSKEEFISYSKVLTSSRHQVK